MPTQSEVASHLILGDARYVRALRDQGVIPDPRSADIDEIREAYIRHLREVAAGRASEDGDGLDLVDERARLAKEQADAQALKNAELRKELIPRSEVETAMVVLASTLAERLGTIPTKVATLIHAAPSIAEAERIIREAIDEARTDVAAEGDRLQAEGVQRATA